MKNLLRNKKSLSDFTVKNIGLFGSFATGTNKKNSDLDFVVEFNDKTFDNYIGLKLFLEQQFKRPVDLVMPNTIKPSLKQAILKQVVYVKGL